MQEQNPTDYQIGRSEQDISQETPQFHNQQYTTHINELISEPVTDNMALVAAQYIFTSLYQLSSYLFSKKIVRAEEDEDEDGKLQLSFNAYLEQMGDQLGRLGRARNNRQSLFQSQMLNMEAELVKCYQKVESIYFQDKYFLDFSYFEMFYSEVKNTSQEKREKVNMQLDNLCQSLDLVEINLFSQIHCKFQEYFAVAANFQYLQESVKSQLIKLTESRKRIKKVKFEFVDQSQRLRKKLIQRQNIEKVLKTIKIVKSLKKLPQVIESILASSLPYECLSLLQQTKSSLDSVKNLKSLTTTADSVRQMQILAQNDLTKRYASELYLYLQECHNKDFINLQQLWKRIELRSCLDKDNSLVIDQLNSSTDSALSDTPQILDDVELLDQANAEMVNSKSLLPRHEGRQYQIAMILLQSYKFVNFSPQVTKIKVGNALRIFCKRFEKQLLSYLDKVIKDQIATRKHQSAEEQGKEGEKPAQSTVAPTEIKKKQSDQQNIPTDIVEKVSVQFYVKHVSILNQIFKETINRFLGYLQTLITEYEEQLGNEDEKTKIFLPQMHNRFKAIFMQECSLLPNIFKIIEQKIKYLLTLKNISSINSVQFYQWISVLKYWQRFFDYLIDEHPLLNRPNLSQNKPISELIDIVIQNVKKAIAAMGLKTLLYELTVDYINVYHKNTLNNQIINTLQEDTWQSTEVPPQFSEILQSIVNPDGQILNSSITILDFSSSSSRSGNNSRELSKGDISRQDGKSRLKFKLLKTYIMVGGVRYRLNLSFLILCEVLEQYLKMARILANIIPRQQIEEVGYNKINKFIFEKIFSVIEKYCTTSRELILETKALKFEKLKGKSINAKHICLLCNCLSVVSKITQEMMDSGKIQKYGLTATKNSVLAALQATHSQLINKLSLILGGKIEKEITDFNIQEKQNPNIPTASKTNKSVITSFLQMVEITQEYLEIQYIKKILKPAFQTFSQKYFVNLLLKGEKSRGQVQMLGQKLKFMRKYFQAQYDALIKEIPV